MRKNTQFLKSFLLISTIFIFIFSSIFYLESSRLEKKRNYLFELSKQELSLNEHLFSVALIQGKISNLLAVMIQKTDSLLSEEKFQNQQDKRTDIVLTKSTLDEQIIASLSEYSLMKQNLTEQDASYLINLLSIDLYFIEMKEVEKKLNNSFEFLRGTFDKKSVALFKEQLLNAQASNERIIQTYKKEINFVSSNVEALVTSSYNDIYQSNYIMSLISGGALLVLLLFTYFSLIVPLHSMSSLTDRLIKNPHFVEDVSVYPGELQDVVSKLQALTENFVQKEESLTQEKVEFREYEKMKNKYYTQIQSEIERPMGILDNTLQRVVSDKSISKEGRKLVELAEHEYDHLKKLLHKAGEVSAINNDPFQVKYTDTNLMEFVNGEISNIKIKDASAKKFLIQIDPELPKNMYLDQLHLRQILEYAYKALGFTSTGTHFALNISMVNLHDSDFILFDLKLDSYQLNKVLTKKDNYLSTFSKHESNSAEFHIYQNLAAALGGTLDFKLDNEAITEFRLMLPLVGQSDLENELVG